MGSYLIFDTRIKWHCDNEQIAQGNFQYTDWCNVLTKGMFVYSATQGVKFKVEH